MINDEIRLAASAPNKANYRYIHSILKMFFGSKVEHIPEEYELINTVFKKAGGSWKSLFEGSFKDIALLKKIIKLAFKKKLITRKVRLN